MKKLFSFKNFFKKDNKISLDDNDINKLIFQSIGKVKSILEIIKNNLKLEYIVLSNKDYSIRDMSKLRNLGFDVEQYDDSNEYSEDFNDKFKIKWKFKN